MTTVTAERQKAVHVRLMEILFITRTGRYSSSFSLHQLTFFRHFPPIIITWLESREKSWESSFFSLPFYFPVFTREKDIPVYWEKNNRNG
jgi:hypothetical protein